MSLRLDEFLARLSEFRGPKRADWTRYRAARARILKDARASFQLDQFRPECSSFVRNWLINEVYLPLVGDNLAKQMGAAGEGKRTDLMGMLLLISPPGYGTTLMEYISQQLGLVFVKIIAPPSDTRFTASIPKRPALPPLGGGEDQPGL